MRKVLFSRDQDVSQTFANEFAGMTSKPVTLLELENVRRELKTKLRAMLTENQRQLLPGLVRGEPDWQLMKRASVGVVGDRIMAI